MSYLIYKNIGIRVQFLLIITIILGFTFFSCVPIQTSLVEKGYGDKAPYGIHVGIDYEILMDTPIIACSDGEVIAIYEPGTAYYQGGTSIRILHLNEKKGNPNFVSIYTHLNESLVGIFEKVKRGQLIGLSGKSNDGFAHLHFQLMKPGTLGEMQMRNTYNPSKFAIGGQIQCYDPSRDYSEFSQTDITSPIPCNEYKNKLLSQTKESTNQE